MMTLPALLGDFWGAILAYVFFYPVLMSLFWMIGGISFYLRFERHPHRIVSEPPERQDYPLVAVLVPCYNEEAQRRGNHWRADGTALSRTTRSSPSTTAARTAPANCSTGWRHAFPSCA